MREFPSPEDWLSQISNDLIYLEIKYSHSYIKLVTKNQFRQIIKEKLKLKCNEYLQSLQNCHTKTRKLVIDDKIQMYLTSDKLSTSEKKFLFLLKTRMIKSKNNFTYLFSDLKCRMCLSENSEETLVHLSVCQSVREKICVISEVDPDDIFGDLEAQVKSVRVWIQVFSMLEQNDTQEPSQTNMFEPHA